MSDSVDKLFDRVADVYDESVPFFATFARRLVGWSNLRAGMRLVDLGAGRGAVSIAVAEALGLSCSILAVGISPEMIVKVEALRLPQLQTRLLDAHSLALPDRPTDSNGVALGDAGAPKIRRGRMVSPRRWVPLAGDSSGTHA